MLLLASLATEDTSDTMDADRDSGGELGGLRNECRVVDEADGNAEDEVDAVELGAKANGSSLMRPDGGDARPV